MAHDSFPRQAEYIDCPLSCQDGCQGGDDAGNLPGRKEGAFPPRGKGAPIAGESTVDKFRTFMATVPGKTALGVAGAVVVLVLILVLGPVFGEKSVEQKSGGGRPADPNLSRIFQNQLASPLSLAILAPRPNIPVNSYPATLTRPLSDWQTDARKTMGWVDSASLFTAAGAPRQPAALTNEDLLVVSGWAGEMDIGVRIHRVLLVVCDRVVGTVAVDLPRPDVAEKVHTNLARSGWTAKLAVGHLPRCPDAALTAWGTNRSGNALFPLAGRVQVSLPPLDPLLSLKHFTSPPVFAPGDDPPAPVRAVTFPAKKTPLLRRPAGDAMVSDHVDGGRYTVTVLENTPDWLQVVVGDKAGWVAKSAIKIEN